MSVPEIKMESFSGTSRFFEKLVGGTPSEADEKLRRIEENAKHSPRRVKLEEPQVAAPHNGP